MMKKPQGQCCLSFMLLFECKDFESTNKKQAYSIISSFGQPKGIDHESTIAYERQHR